jgi:hypothetical protein
VRPAALVDGGLTPEPQSFANVSPEDGLPDRDYEPLLEGSERALSKASKTAAKQWRPWRDSNTEPSGG